MSAVPAAVVELADPLGGPRQVGDDEADARIQLALVPLDLGHDPARLGPALRLVAEAGEEHLRLVRRPADGPRQQVPDPLLQHRVGRQADGVADPLRLQQLVELGLGERRVAAEPKRQAALTVAGDHRLQHGAPALLALCTLPGRRTQRSRSPPSRSATSVPSRTWRRQRCSRLRCSPARSATSPIPPSAR